MKRQKRSAINRAQQRGYQAGMNGKSRDLCPFEGGEMRHEWLTGWRTGREDHWSGMNTLAQVQRLSNM
ncbi:MAG: ribosome modulation factor [Agarilytica sp.]